MKKTIRVICLFLVIFLAACSSARLQKPTPPPDGAQTADTPPVPNPPPTDQPPIVIVPPPNNATIEYGEPDLITDNSGPLWAYIRFPVAGDVTDEVIAVWAGDAYTAAHDEVTELCKNDPAASGEINIQFDSFYVDGRYAGVLENGMFMASNLAHPQSIIKTFNIDTQNGTFLGNEEILDYSQLENILSVMREAIAKEHPGTVNELDGMDEKWLEHIAVGQDGVIAALDRGVFLPAYLGTLVVTLPYEKLGSAFKLRTAQEVTPESPSPSPTTPSPSPTTPPSPSQTPTTPPPAPIIPNVPPQSGDIDPSQPMIALSFDDGPSRYTSQVLDILERYGARATFCVIGNLVDARRDNIKRASNLGCEIIGHSWDHRDLSKLSEEAIKQELYDTSDIIESVTGLRPGLFRPPYGAVSSTLKSVSAELGYAMINWNVDPMDWDTRDADKVYNAIMADVSNRAIVLSHDLYGSTADAMERVIPELIAKGYQLVTVSELMFYSNKTLEAGVVYYSGR